MKNTRHLPVSVALLVLFLVSGFSTQVLADNLSSGPIIQLAIKGPIGPATDDYVQRSLESAAQRNAGLVVLLMDTPGGLDTAMRGIVKNISNATVPIVSYVAPSGSRAASAGTYILYASHIAAMAPGTNLGAATPVQIGGAGPSDGNDKSEKEREAAGDKDDMSRKAVNDAVAYIRGLAQLRGRNQEWAEKAVREAASLPAQEALELGVIDIIATDLSDLMRQLDGREITIMGQKRALQTTGIPIERLDPDWRSRLLSVITNPNIAYILMLVGIYGLILEFSNPGAIVPGTVGAICLMLALYAFQLLPVNYAGMGLILLGAALMVGEAFQPSFGVLGIGGLVAFVFGSIILMDTDVPGYGIDIPVIITFATTSALIFIFVVGLAIKARRRPVVSGLEELVGSEAIAAESFKRRGRVAVHSEIWQASSKTPVREGQTLTVIGLKGLTLLVKAVDVPAKEKP